MDVFAAYASGGIAERPILLAETPILQAIINREDAEAVGLRGATGSVGQAKEARARIDRAAAAGSHARCELRICDEDPKEGAAASKAAKKKTVVRLRDQVIVGFKSTAGTPGGRGGRPAKKGGIGVLADAAIKVR